MPASKASRHTHASPSYPVRSPQTLRKKTLRHPAKALKEPSPQGPWGQSQRRTAEASITALSRGGGRALRDTLAAPRGQGRGAMLVNSPSRVYTKLGP